MNVFCCEKGNNADWPYVDTQKGKSDDRGGITSTLFLKRVGSIKNEPTGSGLEVGDWS